MRQGPGGGSSAGVVTVKNMKPDHYNVGDVVPILGTTRSFSDLVERTHYRSEVLQLNSEGIVYKSHTTRADDTHCGRWGIALEYAKSGELFKVLHSGIVATQITLVDTDHQYVDVFTPPASADGLLESATAGSARILQTDHSNVGVNQLALIHLIGQPGTLATTLDGDLNTGSSALCENTYTIHDDLLEASKKIASGAKVTAHHRNGASGLGWYLLTANKCPEDQ